MLPLVREHKKKEYRQTLSFSGLDLSCAPKEGTLSDCENLCSTAYPFVGVRAARNRVCTLNDGSTLGQYNGLYYVDGTDFYYKDKIRGTVKPGKKQMAVMANKIVIFPDKLCYNIEEDTMEPLEIIFSYALPEAEGKLVFSENTITYETDDTEFSFVHMGFRVGDGLTIDGFYSGDEEDIEPQDIWYGQNNQTLVVRKVEPRVLTFSEGSFLSVTPTKAWGKEITICREVPTLSVLCEWNNRLWGAEGNTIYASKPGEPESFFVYEGVATDSYAVAVGTGGAFTACRVLGSCLLFFKEDGVHTVYGTRPQSFRVLWKPMPGVAKGCEDSLVVLPEGLFYFSTNGPYIYNGAVCSYVGKALGEHRFCAVCASFDGRLVYCAMTDAQGTRALYTWNTQNRIWLKEDETAITALCFDGQHMYLMTKDALYTADGGTERVTWRAAFHPMAEENVRKKRYFCLWLSVELSENAYFSVEISIDEAPSMFCGTIKEAGSHLLPLHLPPCQSMKLTLWGEGTCRIKEITRQYTEF